MERLLRAKEVRDRYALPSSSLYKLVKENRIPHLRFGEAVRFPEDTLEAWIRARIRGADEGHAQG